MFLVVGLIFSMYNTSPDARFNFRFCHLVNCQVSFPDIPAVPAADKPDGSSTPGVIKSPPVPPAVHPADEFANPCAETLVR